ncbi:hypothetical protein [Kluyvera sichuanensis]
MKQIGKDIFTTEYGELSIVPSLEIIFRATSINDMNHLVSMIFAELVQHGILHLDKKAYHIVLSNNYKDTYFEKTLDLATYKKMELAFKLCIELTIRKKTTLLNIFHYDKKTKNNTEMFRLACGNNLFPDDPIALSLQIFTSHDNPWSKLEKLCNHVIKKSKMSFFHATIGYRFAINIDKVKKAILAMEKLCFRYPGVDLDDIFCMHIPLSLYKLRTINWITMINASEFNNDESEPIIYYYQTGELPSLCDRNIGDIKSIEEYQKIDFILNDIIYNSSELSWLSEWQPESYTRWANRWRELII